MPLLCMCWIIHLTWRVAVCRRAWRPFICLCYTRSSPSFIYVQSSKWYRKPSRWVALAVQCWYIRLTGPTKNPNKKENWLTVPRKFYICPHARTHSRHDLSRRLTVPPFFSSNDSLSFVFPFLLWTKCWPVLYISILTKHVEVFILRTLISLLEDDCQKLNG